MARQSRRDRWSWAVARTTSLHPTTRLFLSSCLARHMNSKGQVCWPRNRLAAEFGITERRVSAHIQKAKEAGWLVIIMGGVRGHTAEYEATFPDANRVTTPDTLCEPEKGDGYKHPKWVTFSSPYPRNRVTRTSPQVVSTYNYACSGNFDTCRCDDCTEWRWVTDRPIEGRARCEFLALEDESKSKSPRRHLRLVERSA